MSHLSKAFSLPLHLLVRSDILVGRYWKFLTRDKAQVYNLTAAKEVILSAGAVMTPAILMHSGIGDSAELESVGIETIVNLPDLGKNIQDHVSVEESASCVRQLTLSAPLHSVIALDCPLLDGELYYHLG